MPDRDLEALLRATSPCTGPPWEVWHREVRPMLADWLEDRGLGVLAFRTRLATDLVPEVATLPNPLSVSHLRILGTSVTVRVVVRLGTRAFPITLSPDAFFQWDCGRMGIHTPPQTTIARVSRLASLDVAPRVIRPVEVDTVALDGPGEPVAFCCPILPEHLSRRNFRFDLWHRIQAAVQPRTDSPPPPPAR